LAPFAIVVFSPFLSTDSSRPFQKWDLIFAHLQSPRGDVARILVGGYDQPILKMDGLTRQRSLAKDLEIPFTLPPQG